MMAVLFCLCVCVCVHVFVVLKFSAYHKVDVGTIGKITIGHFLSVAGWWWVL